MTVFGVLVVGLALFFQSLAQPSPSPSPTPTQKDNFEESARKLTEELEKTKKESSAALEESKKLKPRPKSSPVSIPAKARKKSRSSRKGDHAVIVAAPKTEETNQGSQAQGEIVPRPTIPLNKIKEKPIQSNPVKVTKKKKTFWQKVWHILPFRFFGEH